MPVMNGYEATQKIKDINSNKVEDAIKKAEAYEQSVRPYLEEVRNHIDKLELVVDNEMWPLPKYRELLFVR